MTTVLVVEADARARSLLALYLQGTYHVLEAANPVEAVQIGRRYDGEIALAIIGRAGSGAGEVVDQIFGARPGMAVLVLADEPENGAEATQEPISRAGLRAAVARVLAASPRRSQQ